MDVKTKKVKKVKKVYRCEDCNQNFRDSWLLKRHMSGMKHNPERYKKYYCKLCNYTTPLKSRMKLHEKTKKHKKRLSISQS